MVRIIELLLVGIIFFLFTTVALANPKYEHKLPHAPPGVRREKKPILIKFLSGLTFSGQITMIYQTSNLDLKRGDLVSVNGSPRIDFADFRHKNATGTFSADLFLEKKLDNGYLLFNLEFASGGGTDAPLQGGGMVNNDVMEDPSRRNKSYIARTYYEHTLPLNNNYKLVFDVGKFGVPDFFDIGEQVSDQTTQFLNQAICNNGAFDYVQDLQGHGYTYGIRSALETPWVVLSGAVMSADSYLENLNDKYSLIAALEFDYKFSKTERFDLEGNLYVFKNHGEYARFDSEGNFISKDPGRINTKGNVDDLDKAGFGISLTQHLPLGINLFGKYGRQDDDRDVRHYQDMDESILFGVAVSGENWRRENDVLGVAYQTGKLTGNHRKAHEKGYESFFNRPGIGPGNYAHEKVLEVYYQLAMTKQTSLSADCQYIDNFYYSKQIGAVIFWGIRFNITF